MGAASALLTIAVGGCGGAPPADPALGNVGVSAAPSRATVTFTFPSLDERPVSSAAFQGRPVVLAFVATWDLPSQAQLSYLREMAKREARRESAPAFVAVFMQEARDRELVDVYRSTLGIDFPAALAPPPVVSSSFPDVQSVPTTLVLDGSGHVRFQKVGLAKPDELRGALHAR